MIAQGGRLMLGIALGFVLAGGALACSETKSPANTEGPIMQLAPAQCGSKGQPDCPLQSWMKATLSAYLNAREGERLAASLEELGRHAPPGYTGWESSTESGARAARAGDFATARAQCKQCHELNRARYRVEMRTTQLF